jgi:hypothetical protein
MATKSIHAFYKDLGTEMNGYTGNYIMSNQVIASPFLHKTFFSQLFVKVTHICFLIGNS